jgi:hypothetical protein
MAAMWKLRSGVFVAICLLLLVAATLFVSPAWRHAHHGGDQTHVHGDGHSHDHHAHSHSHSHSHGHHGHSHDHGDHHHGHDHHEADANHNADPHHSSGSHIHISFLWFDLTLPDFSGADETQADSRSADDDSDRGELVELRSPLSFGQLISVLLLIKAPLPERLCWTPGDSSAMQAAGASLLHSRLPDAPTTPPPEWA